MGSKRRGTRSGLDEILADLYELKARGELPDLAAANAYLEQRRTASARRGAWERSAPGLSPLGSLAEKSRSRLSAASHPVPKQQGGCDTRNIARFAAPRNRASDTRERYARAIRRSHAAPRVHV